MGAWLSPRKAHYSPHDNLTTPQLLAPVSPSSEKNRLQTVLGETLGTFAELATPHPKEYVNNNWSETHVVDKVYYHWVHFYVLTWKLKRILPWKTLLYINLETEVHTIVEKSFGTAMSYQGMLFWVITPQRG